jgi:hypothetical protein
VRGVGMKQVGLQRSAVNLIALSWSTTWPSTRKNNCRHRYQLTFDQARITWLAEENVGIGYGLFRFSTRPVNVTDWADSKFISWLKIVKRITKMT